MIVLVNSNDYILEAKGLTKYFGPVCALNNVDFELRKGEVLGLLGDNGAGKSTLIKILSGAAQTDRGDIYFEGNKVNIKQPEDSINLGIETIYQDLSLFDNLDFTKNILSIYPFMVLMQIIEKDTTIKKLQNTILILIIMEINPLMWFLKAGKLQ